MSVQETLKSHEYSSYNQFEYSSPYIPNISALLDDSFHAHEDDLSIPLYPSICIP